MNEVPTPNRRAVLRVAAIAAVSAAGATWMALAAKTRLRGRRRRFRSRVRVFPTRCRRRRRRDRPRSQAVHEPVRSRPVRPSAAGLQRRGHRAASARRRAAVEKAGLRRRRPGAPRQGAGLLQPAHDAPLHRDTPASLETRFVAANTFLGMPSMFNRARARPSAARRGAAKPAAGGVAAAVSRHGVAARRAWPRRPTTGPPTRAAGSSRWSAAVRRRPAPRRPS